MPWPFRLAIVGAGPSAFYAASRVLSRLPEARVHLFDRLWAPHGLVRYGVAPDHPEVKARQHCTYWSARFHTEFILRLSALGPFRTAFINLTRQRQTLDFGFSGMSRSPHNRHSRHLQCPPL
jgi:hypothetical protein